MYAFARFCMLFLAFTSAAANASTAHAQIAPTKPYPSLVIPSQDVPNRGADEASPLRRAIDDLAVPPLSALSAPTVEQKPGRGVVLPVMYLGLGTLQALDTHSTFRAVDAGLAEQNPLMRWAVDHPVAFVSLKGAATAGTILVAEKIRKKYPKRAVAFMAAINAAYAVVVIHNYRASSGTQ
jgi:Domain of unknown function (DUF5658)